MEQVVTGALIHRERLLLGHRSAGRASFPSVWDLPGSHVEFGEAPLDAPVRELTEELGVVISRPAGPPLARLHPPVWVRPEGRYMCYRTLQRAQCWITTGAVTITAISARISCHSGADMSLCESRRAGKHMVAHPSVQLCSLSSRPTSSSQRQRLRSPASSQTPPGPAASRVPPSRAARGSPRTDT
jgi:hypothetical protein